MTILFLLRCYPFHYHYSSFRGHFLDLLEDASELNGLVTESARLLRVSFPPFCKLGNAFYLVGGCHRC
jgi:hypothetical protein